MQYLTRKQLFELAKSSKLTEAENLNFDYEEFKAKWKIAEQEIKKVNYRNKSDLIPSIYKYVAINYLTAVKQYIKYVKRAGSRNIFILNSGKCLKVAINKNGIIKNKQEVKNFRANKNLNCFAQIYDVDKLSYSSVITDCYTEVKINDFDALLGMPLKTIVNQIMIFIYDTYNIANYEDPYDYKNYKSDEERDKQIAVDKKEFQKNCSDNKNENWNVIRDLLKFYKLNKNNINELVPEELIDVSSWGLVLRNGKPVLVLVNYGVSEEVMNGY